MPPAPRHYVLHRPEVDIRPEERTSLVATATELIAVYERLKHRVTVLDAARYGTGVPNGATVAEYRLAKRNRIQPLIDADAVVLERLKRSWRRALARHGEAKLRGIVVPGRHVECDAAAPGARALPCLYHYWRTPPRHPRVVTTPLDTEAEVAEAYAAQPLPDDPAPVFEKATAILNGLL